MALPIHLIAGTLDFSKFDSSLKSFEYGSKVVNSTGGKTSIAYTGLNSNHEFMASDYVYPHNSNQVSGNIWLLDKNDTEIEDSATNYIVDYDSIISSYALAPNQILQLTDEISLGCLIKMAIRLICFQRLVLELNKAVAVIQPIIIKPLIR